MVNPTEDTSFGDTNAAYAFSVAVLTLAVSCIVVTGTETADWGCPASLPGVSKSKTSCYATITSHFREVSAVHSVLPSTPYRILRFKPWYSKYNVVCFHLHH